MMEQFERTVRNTSTNDLGCHSLDFPSVRDYLEVTNEFGITLICLGGVALFTTVAIFIDTLRHVLRNAKSSVKAYTTFLIALYPVICFISYCSILVPRSHLLSEALTQVIFTAGMYELFRLFVSYAGGEAPLINKMNVRLSLKTGPCCCWPCFVMLPTFEVNKNTVKFLKCLVLQLPLIQGLLYFIILVMWIEDKNLYQNNYWYVQPIIIISFFSGIWGILMTIGLLREMLDPQFRLIHKFGLLQAIFVFAKVQDLLVRISVTFDWLPCSPPVTPQVYAKVFHNTLMTMETVLLGLLARNIYKRNIPDIDVSRHMEKASNNNNNNNIAEALQKNFHMNFVRKSMLLLAIWPFSTGGIAKILYELYFWASYTCIILFSISEFIFAVLTWSEDYFSTASSMEIAIEYASNAYKVLIFKSETFKALIREISRKEARIFDCKDSELIEIYVNNAAHNRKTVLLFTIMGSISISLYYITPLVNNFLIPLGINNETGVKYHHFIVHGWFPFDPNRHYVTAYLMQLTGCMYGYAYVVYCGAFYISMLSFVSAQLKMLQHMFINFPKYALRIARQFDLAADQSQFVLLRKLIEEHLTIISFVQRMNNAMKLYTFLNFLTSSFQLSLVVYQMFKANPLERIAVLSYFITITTQLFLTYNAAHNVTIESEKVATSIFMGNWDTYPQNILNMMQIVSIRAQRPLEFNIGPIGQVKVDALLRIFKALYSYISIIMTL